MHGRHFLRLRSKIVSPNLIFGGLTCRLFGPPSPRFGPARPSCGQPCGERAQGQTRCWRGRRGLDLPAPQTSPRCASAGFAEHALRSPCAANRHDIMTSIKNISCLLPDGSFFTFVASSWLSRVPEPSIMAELQSKSTNKLLISIRKIIMTISCFQSIHLDSENPKHQTQNEILKPKRQTPLMLATVCCFTGKKQPK